MRYTCNLPIDKNINDVIALFDNPDNLTAWMEGLQKFEHISGTPGEPGAKSHLTFLHKGREMVLTETILERDLPRVFKASYESPMGYNEVAASFEKIDDNTTQYSTDNYFKLKGVMKFMAPLMKGAFKKQSMKYLHAFKAFAEGK